MKHTGILFVALCASFVCSALGQQAPSTCVNDWSEFHRTNMQRFNPCEKVLGVSNVGNLTLKWVYTTGFFVES